MARCRKAAGRELSGMERGLNWSIDTVRSGLGRRYAVISSARDSWIPIWPARRVGLDGFQFPLRLFPRQGLLRQGAGGHPGRNR